MSGTEKEVSGMYVSYLTVEFEEGSILDQIKKIHDKSEELEKMCNELINEMEAKEKTVSGN